MQFVHTDLGYVRAGATVTVRLTGNAANVALVDAANFAKYRRRQAHRVIGGHYRQSPVTLRTPSSGHWHVVVDLGGAPGRVGSQVTVSQ
jgi:hypothetical protein